MYVPTVVGNVFVNKTSETTQREANGTTQERRANEQNQTDRIRHHKDVGISGSGATKYVCTDMHFWAFAVVSRFPYAC